MSSGMMVSDIVTAASAQTDRQQQAKLVDGAQQFEAMLLGEMLKPLQFGEGVGADDSNGTGGSDGSSGGANDKLRSMGVEALTKSLAKGDGFGIAQRIVRQVNAQHGRAERNRGSTKVS